MRNLLMGSRLIVACVTAQAAVWSLAPSARADLFDTKARKWTYERAAHLLRRAGFGGSPEQIERLHEMGLEAAVDYLVDYEKTPQPDPAFATSEVPRRDILESARGTLSEAEVQELRNKLQVVNRGQIGELRAWWLRRMVITPRPFEEKMTLFWHGHFTSGFEEVKASGMLAAQNDLLRRHAVAPFGDLLLAICQDPAMLVYLDGVSNRKDHPNENFARELLELFTMGAGHYSERDITEAARAFTGWTIEDGAFRFRKGWHDYGAKTFLGQSGQFNGDDIVQIVLDQLATQRYLARKLLTFFVTEEPTDEMVGAMVYRLRVTKYNIREVMRALFKSEAFYADAVLHAHIKSPVEYTVGMMRQLQVAEPSYWVLAVLTRDMGQELFQPPNVKGWDGGRTWITTATLFARADLARVVLRGMPEKAFEARQIPYKELLHIRGELAERGDRYPGLKIAPTQVELTRPAPYDPATLLGGQEAWTAGAAVDRYLRVLLQRPVSAQQRAALVGVLGVESATLDLTDAETTERLREVLLQILTLPEYQLS